MKDQAQDTTVVRAIQGLSRIRNTVESWGLRILLRDLYDWNEPLTSANWRQLDDLVRERSVDPAWPREVLRRAGIRRSCTDLAGRGIGHADDSLQYSLEWGAIFSSRTNEADAALYELERTWGRTPEPPSIPATGLRPPTYKIIRSVHEAHDAVEHYVRSLPVSQIVGLTLRITRAMPAHPPSVSEFVAALENRNRAGRLESGIYLAYIAECLLASLEGRGGEVAVVIHTNASGYGAEDRAIAGVLTGWASRHSALRVVCLPDSTELNSALCATSRSMPNLAISGIPWGQVSQAGIQSMIADRLDLLPWNRQCAFASGAHCVEWAYARAAIARKLWSEVLAARVRIGEFDFDTAMSIAREVYFDSARAVLRMTGDPGELRG